MSDSSATGQTPSQPVATDAKAGTAADAAATAAGAAAAATLASSAAAAPVKPDAVAAAAADPAKPAAAAAADAAKPAEGDAATKAAADKAAADAKAAADKAAADAAAAAAAAEVYELAAPKGVTFDPAIAEGLGPVFKDLKLPKAAGEKLVNAFVEIQKTLPAKMLARDLDALRKDPELGGMNLGKTQGLVNDALAAFTTPEFRAQLERWGVANNLEFVRVFASIGRAMRGDTPVRGHPTGAEESVADRIYGRSTKVNAQ